MQSTNDFLPLQWDLAPIVEWLFREGRLLGSAEELTRELGQILSDNGVPIWRLRLSIRTLHPLVTAKTSVWEKGTPFIEPVETRHGIENRPEYIGSPIQIIADTRRSFRKRLCEGLTDSDHKVLHEFKARGATDYFGIPMIFTDDAAATLVFTSDTKNGFTDLDIAQFEQIAFYLAPIAEVYCSRSVSHAIAHSYLGARTGQRVLSGQITRGHIEKIDAAILISDIRNWTGLNNRISNDQALSLANKYFEVIAEAVEQNDGEILKFLGDGVLAIFPLEHGQSDSSVACDRALAAARQALNKAREADTPLELNFGIGMHFGEVLYGNIGSKTRIDFTVMGQAVNIAARIESQCSKHDRSVLFSQEFAHRISEPATLVTEKRLKGYDMKFKVMSTSDFDPPW